MHHNSTIIRIVRSQRFTHAKGATATCRRRWRSRRRRINVISLPSAKGDTTTTKPSITMGRRPGCRQCGHQTPWIAAVFGGGGHASVKVSPVKNIQNKRTVLFIMIFIIICWFPVSEELTLRLHAVETPLSEDRCHSCTIPPFPIWGHGVRASGPLPI